MDDSRYLKKVRGLNLNPGLKVACFINPFLQRILSSIMAAFVDLTRPGLMR